MSQLCSKPDDLERLELTTCTQTKFCSIGQCNYGFANACLDLLAEQRRAEGLPAFSIQFGVVDNVGVADKRMQVSLPITFMPELPLLTFS